MNTKIKDPHFLVVRFDAVGLPYAALCPDKDHIRKHHPDRALAFEIARDLYTLVGVATSTQATRDVLTIALLAMAQPTRYGDKVISLDPETLEPTKKEREIVVRYTRSDADSYFEGGLGEDENRELTDGEWDRIVDAHEKDQTMIDFDKFYDLVSEEIDPKPKPEPVTVRVDLSVRCPRCFLVYPKQRMSEDGLCPVCVNETKGVR